MSQCHHARDLELMVGETWPANQHKHATREGIAKNSSDMLAERCATRLRNALKVPGSCHDHGGIVEDSFRGEGPK